MEEADKEVFWGEMLPSASGTSGGAEEGLSPWRADRPWVSCSVQPWQSPCTPNRGSPCPGAPGEDISPNHCSDNPWIQAGEKQQGKHHLFQEECGIILHKLTD